MSATSTPAVALWMALAAACSPPDISGVYETTRAAADEGVCVARTATTTPAFFVVREGSLLGLTLVTVRACSAADPATCAARGVISEAPMTLGTPSGWEGQADGAAGLPGGPCRFSTVAIAARQADDLSVTVEASRRADSRASEACDADDVPDDLPCAAAQTVVGRRIADAPPPDGAPIL